MRAAGANVQNAPELSLMRVPLGTEIEDADEAPARDLQAHVDRTRTSTRPCGAKELTEFDKHAPAATLALSARLLAGSSLGFGQRAPLAGCTIMNVPGPAIPLYLDGARMTYFSAIMPIADGMGLVFSVTSYDGMIFISPTSCREQMPDPEFFAQCIRDSFQEYLALATKPKKGKKKKVACEKRRRSEARREGQGRASEGKGGRPRKRQSIPTIRLTPPSPDPASSPERPRPR